MWRPPDIALSPLSRLNSRLSAERAVEDAPEREIIAEIVIMMLDAGGHEQQVAGGKGCSRAVMDKHAMPPDHGIEFILLMGHLKIGRYR